MRQALSAAISAVIVWNATFASEALGIEDANELQQQLERIFDARELDPARFGPARWLDGGESYTTVERSASVDGADDIVRYDTRTGRREILVSAQQLVASSGRAEPAPLVIEDYQWSSNRDRLLVFTNTVRVWRRNTRGDYWVLELASGRLHRLGTAFADSALMFAKFSPDGASAAYVVASNIYVEDLKSGQVTPLTSDGSATTIHGTSDWVYEEELGVRDGFRWSPDSKRIAFWSFDSVGVGEFNLINATDSLYPELTPIPYPKVGTTNSAVRIGVVSAAAGETTWMQVPGDPRNHYVARMEWSGEDELVLQQLNRLQNVNTVYLGNATSGEVEPIHQDRNPAWVELVDRMDWAEDANELVWLSEKDGWRHAFTVRRSGGSERLITRFEGDVIDSLGLGPDGVWFYFIASPTSATERFLYRARLEGSDPPQRLTPTALTGTHGYDVSPNRKWAFHTASGFDEPPRVELVSLPDHALIRTLEDNAELRAKLAGELEPPVEMFRLEIEPDVTLDSWLLKPRDFDPQRTYPLLVYVYGEPAGQTVLDRWFGSRTLFHRAIANQGFVVASFDNRGTPAPRGASWRKVVYGTVGDLSSRDQAAAVRALVQQRPYIDGERVAIWGWSGGGSNTLNAMFRFPDVFHVGVSVAPVPDQTLYDTIYQERYMGLPDDNADGYRLGSPIHFAEGLEGKLLLIHGSGDDNVHYQGTERLVNRLVELGKPFDLMVYPNRSHAIREGKGTSLHVHSLIARYLLETGWVDGDE